MASERLQLGVVGLLSEPPFHIAKCAAEEMKGEVWEFSSQVMCFVNGQLIGDENGLKAWAEDMWDYRDYRPLALYKALAEDLYVKYIQETKHTFVYLDIAIQEQPIGRLLFELFSDVCPKTCKNFQHLCSGESGDSPSGIKLHYKGALFHRIVKNGWIQGGDIVAGKGNGGESIFGGTFEDENYAVPHNKRGVLGMANKGRHTNGSQFYITLQATPYMDRKHVAFGQLVEGSDVLWKMEEIPAYNERPKLNCTILDCGIFIP
ncbi:PREDICTED: peptidyl-prolyl cis-trans isomerase-like 6 isoform X2 [Nanorana parkeri]|uniref:peptidyl-prolyl cis-trans isomerase-like 6 isoform X2 n=1 Tax=Nanorana parkeri TaxID=125878 RepID=UPI000854E18C|nr:PREDICTED: peptidyl-prolyl cis-trans isomerase-like 6 isoform X2 [Nanorana parkeri]